jgi:hypothetical protein
MGTVVAARTSESPGKRNSQLLTWAGGLVEKANKLRRQGKLDMSLENRFSVRVTQNGFGKTEMRVFKIDGKLLPRNLFLEPLKNQKMDPFSPLFNMSEFRSRNPAIEPIRQ